MFWKLKLLSVASFADIFSPSIGCHFILLMVSFAVQKHISLIRSHLFIFAFIYFAFPPLHFYLLLPGLLFSKCYHFYFYPLYLLASVLYFLFLCSFFFPFGEFLFFQLTNSFFSYLIHPFKRMFKYCFLVQLLRIQPSLSYWFFLMFLFSCFVVLIASLYLLTCLLI